MRPGEAEIWRAGVADASEVARLLHAFNAEYGESVPALELLEERVGELIAGAGLVCLLAGDPPVGLAVLRVRPALWSKASALLEELYVTPAERGRGIGGRLFDAAVEAARERGAGHFELNTAEDDTAAIALYESRGMTNREGAPDGPRMLYYERDLGGTT